MIKYRVHEVAKDLNVPNKEVLDTLQKYCGETKKHMTALTEEELDVVFESFTQSHSSASLDDYFASGREPEVTVTAEEEPKAAPAPKQEEPARNKVLEIVYAIACDIHPLNNLRVLRYLTEELNVSEEDKKRWYAHWIQQGLSAVEQLLRQSQSGQFCVGETPTLADCCLVPQWANALRMNCDLSGYPRCKAVYDACTQLPAFIAAAPENQQDKISA